MTETHAAGSVCPNCATPVIGPYCPQCGQRQGAVRVSLRRILAEALEDQFSVNAALPRTLKALLKPGELTREYLSQRIARYIPPVRLYLISSVIFFLLLSFGNGPGRIQIGMNEDVAADSAAAKADTPDADPTIDVNLGNERLENFVRGRIEQLSDLPREEMFAQISEGFLRHAPKVVFILLPVYALLLKVLYFRRYYVEHFIFALHLHAFTFLIFTVLLLLPEGIPVLGGLLAFWIPVYSFFAMKRVYRQGAFKTLIKWWTLGVTYAVVLSFGVVGALLAALVTM